MSSQTRTHCHVKVSSGRDATQCQLTIHLCSSARSYLHRANVKLITKRLYFISTSRVVTSRSHETFLVSRSVLERDIRERYKRASLSLSQLSLSVRGEGTTYLTVSVDMTIYIWSINHSLSQVWWLSAKQCPRGSDSAACLVRVARWDTSL